MNKPFFSCWLVAMLLAPSAWGQTCPTWPTAERFSFNGAEVTDQRTGLIWARCSVGQSWNGSTCTGNARTLTHEAALQHAQSQSGWRLPNVKELSSLADKGCKNPAIDAIAFPATRISFYWASSPHLGGTSSAWFVYFYDGTVDTDIRESTYIFQRTARLVRTSTASSAPVQNPGGSVVTSDAPTVPL